MKPNSPGRGTQHKPFLIRRAIRYQLVIPQVREDMILQISAEQVCLAVQAQSGQATEDPEEIATFRFKGPVCETLRNLGIGGWNKVVSIAKSTPFSAGRPVHMQ